MSKIRDEKESRAEFDQYAVDYYDQHKKNILISGESPDFFSEYKIKDLAKNINYLGMKSNSILDFGSGIGNSVPFFRKYFPYHKLTCADVSVVSNDFAQDRYPGHEDYVVIRDRIPLPSESQDIVFSACVFHHITSEKRAFWLGEINRVLKPNGVLAIYEHNPLNPLTLYAVNTCPLDENAELIFAMGFTKLFSADQWTSVGVGYKVFFPSFLSFFRFIEDYIEWLPLGAQYRLLATKREEL